MKTFYARSRAEWRRWLRVNHRKEPEIWFVFYRKHTGKPSVSYNDAVEEALCYGWIDSIMRKLDENRYAQRFSPRRRTSGLSQMNKERVDKLIAQKKMTRAGLDAIAHAYKGDTKRFVVPPDILNALKADPVIWKNYSRFPAPYRRIRIGYINAARNRPEEFRKRLRHFLKMTAQNKRFGWVKEMR